ncbi:MAG: thrombospondin type-1 domain-containing protein [Candidatus Omnitrophica bacterium]|nr:thrombospondin type-1 domain-containing protein [Candidatus Omnitrophota bacterium]
MLVLTSVVAVTLIGLKSFLPKTKAKAGIYFNRATAGIAGKPNPCGDGICEPNETPETCCADCGGCHLDAPKKNCEWLAWGSCSTTCGTGTKTRSYIPATNGGAACDLSLATTDCTDNSACPKNASSTSAASPSSTPGNAGTGDIASRTRDNLPKDCIETWSACDQPCGGGTQQVTTDPPAQAPDATGKPCLPAGTPRACNTQACPPGYWAEWQDAPGYDCTQILCDGCQQIRSCIKPYAKSADCLADPNGDAATRVIHTQPCAVNGGWGDWQKDEDCKNNIKGGKETRYCNTPAPANGGRECIGGVDPNQTFMMQETVMCKVDGKWSEFSICPYILKSKSNDKQCVQRGMTSTKTRACNNPGPSDGTYEKGDPCKDSNGNPAETETLSCGVNCKCGDGITTEMEVCDPGDPAGKIDPDLNGETCASQTGGVGTLKCKNDCSGYDLTECEYCGDGVKNLKEECDYANYGSQILAGKEAAHQNAVNCVDLGQVTLPNGKPGTFNDGILGCKHDCSFDVSNCSYCGDSKVNPTVGEVCDGNDLSGQSCASETGGEGTLKCKDDCSGYDISQCEYCGDGIKNRSEDCDYKNYGDKTLAGKEAAHQNMVACADLGQVNLPNGKTGRYTSGTLGCQDTCSFDPKNCVYCGDGQVFAGSGKVCDLTNFGGQTCENQVLPGGGKYSGGTLRCSDDCQTIYTDGCLFCGDGKITGTEICDPGNGTTVPENLNGKTCDAYDAKYEKGKGQLHCNSSCDGWDPRDCVEHCGNGACEPALGEDYTNCSDCPKPSCGDAPVPPDKYKPCPPQNPTSVNQAVSIVERCPANPTCEYTCADGMELKNGACVASEMGCKGDKPVNAIECSPGDTTPGTYSLGPNQESCYAGDNFIPCKFYCSAGMIMTPDQKECINARCNGDLPLGALKCPATETDLPGDINWNGVVNPTQCATRKCQYYCDSGYAFASNTCAANSCGVTPPENKYQICASRLPATSSQAYTVIDQCAADPAKNPPCSAACKNGYIKINNACGCPDGKLEQNGICCPPSFDNIDGSCQCAPGTFDYQGKCVEGVWLQNNGASSCSSVCNAINRQPGADRFQGNSSCASGESWPANIDKSWFVNGRWCNSGFDESCVVSDAICKLLTGGSACGHDNDTNQEQMSSNTSYCYHHNQNTDWDDTDKTIACYCK